MKRPALDHLGFACRNLEDLQGLFDALGFCLTGPRNLFGAVDGESPKSLGQVSAHMIFRSTYLEITAVADSASGNHLQPWLQQRCGLHIAACRDDNLDISHQRAAKAGLQPSAISQARRSIDYGKPGEAHFRWWMLPYAVCPDVLYCMVCNEQPQLIYQPQAQNHPNGAQDIVGFTIASPTPRVTQSHWLQILGGQQSPDDAPGRLPLANGDLRFVQLEADNTGSQARVSALTILVKSLNQVIKRLQEKNLPWVAGKKGSVLVELPHPANVTLVLTETTRA